MAELDPSARDPVSRNLNSLETHDSWRRVVLENALDAVVGVDQDDRIIDWNRMAETVFGWRRDQAIGKRMSDLIIPPEYRERHRTGLKRFLETGEGPILNKRFEITALHSTGNVFPIELTVIPILAQGRHLFYSFIRDISDRQRREARIQAAEQALRISEEQLRLITDSLPALIAYIGPDRRYRFANATYTRWFGRRVEDIIGKTTESVLGQEAMKRADPYFVRALNGEAVRYENEIPIEGKKIWIDVEYIPDHAPDGKVRGFIVLAYDVSERKRDEEERSRLTQALKEAVRARDEFISICSHELKTPVTSLKLQFQLAARQIERDDPKAYDRAVIAKRIEATNRQLDRMTRLIDDMLDVSRIAMGRLHLRTEEADLCAVAREVVDRFAPDFLARGVKLELTPCAAAWTRCDRMRTDQVIVNLLTNALKYGDGKPVTVAVSISKGRANLSVRDRGIGIAEDAIGRIFDRFERAVSPGEISGLGLGLYISRQIMEAQGGEIQVSSRLGHGSVFTVSLPSLEGRG